MFSDAADSLARFSSNEKLPERTLFRFVIDLYELNLRKCGWNLLNYILENTKCTSQNLHILVSSFLRRFE